MSSNCGTGGEILGLITAIGRHLPHTKINITAIDGNDGALAILKDLVECNPNKNIQVELSFFAIIAYAFVGRTFLEINSQTILSQRIK